MPSAAETTARARELLPAYRELIRDVGFENKGILFSEALFIIATLGGQGPPRIVESGRARGQSTLLLAKAFPDVEVISVEIDPDSPDARVAEARLAGLPNLELRYGDAERLLFDLVRPGDAVMIDGPKGWRSIRLALRLLARRRPAFAFVHDCYQGIPRRAFLDRHVPGVFFSDDPAFAPTFADLDAPCWESDIRWRPHLHRGRAEASYGPTVACLPRMKGAPYGSILRRLAWAAFVHRLRRGRRR
jgi:SAM-dependent methyltransferase